MPDDAQDDSKPDVNLTFEALVELLGSEDVLKESQGEDHASTSGLRDKDGNLHFGKIRSFFGKPNDEDQVGNTSGHSHASDEGSESDATFKVSSCKPVCLKELQWNGQTKSITMPEWIAITAIRPCG